MFRKLASVFTISLAALAIASGSAAAQDTLKIGASAPKTGPLSGGAAVTYWPNLKLWIHDVNSRGGLNVAGKKLKVELVEYDDKSSSEEAIKNIQRLATVDKVDFVASPYSTGINAATAPVIARYGYPMISGTSATDSLEDFAKRWPNSFWLTGTSTQFATGIVSALKKMRDAGAIGKRVAVVNVADVFGLELVKTGKKVLADAGFEIVYEASYPLGTQDVAPIISGAKAANPDAFIAFSYPPDSFALTQQAQTQKFDVGVFYVAVAAAFPSFQARFKEGVEGIMGAGGVDQDSKAIQDYRKRHKEVTGAEPDNWGSLTTYAALEILGEAIERAGKVDKAAVIAEIRKKPFTTVFGEIDLASGISRKIWTTGQWQKGLYYAVASDGKGGLKEPVKKAPWQ